MTTGTPNQALNGNEIWDAIIIGGGFAGLSAAIYLSRARRKTLLLDSDKSLALWEPHVQNYLGFPDGISGEELLRLGKEQARRYGTLIEKDLVINARKENAIFSLESQKRRYTCKRLLLATGLYHLPPAIPGVDACLGHSMFFCKDCDAYRVQGKQIVIIGDNNEAVEYALGMLNYTACVIIASNGKPGRWDEEHESWIQEYAIPVRYERITEVEHKEGQVFSLSFNNSDRLAVDSVFTTRGDIYHNELAKRLDAETDSEGQILVNDNMLTSVPGLFAAGCVTPANCQMIVAAGQGAAAAQAINRDLFEESLRTHSLRRFRKEQLQKEQTFPEVIESNK